MEFVLKPSGSRASFPNYAPGQALRPHTEKHLYSVWSSAVAILNFQCLNTEPCISSLHWALQAMQLAPHPPVPSQQKKKKEFFKT